MYILGLIFMVCGTLAVGYGIFGNPSTLSSMLPDLVAEGIQHPLFVSLHDLNILSGFTIAGSALFISGTLFCVAQRIRDALESIGYNQNYHRL